MFGAGGSAVKARTKVPVVNDVYVIDALRTPIGRYGGVLANARPDDLAGHVIAAAVERNGLAPASVDEVYMGCTNQAGEDNRNVARMGALLAGLPVEVPGVTVNRLCASGLEAVNQGARQVMTGDADHIVDPEDHSVRLAQELGDAELRIVPRAGHMLHHAVPLEVAEAIARVVSGRGRLQEVA